MDAEGYPSQEAAIYSGAGLGAIAGAAGIGGMLHDSGRAYEKLADRLAPRYKEVKGERVLAPRKSPIGKPGGRMAGATLFAILGAGLGMKLREQMIPEEQASELLAKLQSGTMTEDDTFILQQVLKDTYNQMGVA